ncbi:MAG: hypothetical protein GF353_09375 [Candidatus Lokiarchaeota archaeon]|nr:hypothetical protein [Candidatus Lokiarchaeota archaeon]
MNEAVQALGSANSNIGRKVWMDTIGKDIVFDKSPEVLGGLWKCGRQEFPTILFLIRGVLDHTFEVQKVR